MITGQIIGNDIMLDDGQTIIFTPLIQGNEIDWMTCPHCGVSWFDVTPAYFKCRRCGHQKWRYGENQEPDH